MKYVYVWEHAQFRGRTEQRYSIMDRDNVGLIHVFPGRTFTLADAQAVCREKGWTIAKVGELHQLG